MGWRVRQALGDVSEGSWPAALDVEAALGASFDDVAAAYPSAEAAADGSPKRALALGGTSVA